VSNQLRNIAEEEKTRRLDGCQNDFISISFSLLSSFLYRLRRQRSPKQNANVNTSSPRYRSFLCSDLFVLCRSFCYLSSGCHLHRVWCSNYITLSLQSLLISKPTFRTSSEDDGGGALSSLTINGNGKLLWFCYHFRSKTPVLTRLSNHLY